MRKLLTILMTLSFAVSAAQSLGTTQKSAQKNFDKANQAVKARDFQLAIALYQKALAKDPNFLEAYLKLGNAFQTLRKEDSVLYYLEQFYHRAQFSQQIPGVLQTLSRLYFESGQYEKASEALDLLIQKKPDALASTAIADLQTRVTFSVNNYKKVEVLYDLLPSAVNGFFSQYFPAISVDGNTLLFTKRDGPELYHDEDIMVSYFQDNEWMPAEPISSLINSRNNEGAPAISADGRTLIFSSCDEGKTLGSCDLFISRRTGMVWSKPQNLGAPVNSIYWDSQPSLSADGRKLYFSSNRPGGQGGRDLYVSEWINDKWTTPANLGPIINTSSDETTPYIHVNNETLFFSSNGHPGFGRFDLFVSEMTNGVWSSPVNLGYGINDHLDQLAMIITYDGKKGYFSVDNKDENGRFVSKLATIELQTDTMMAHAACYITGRIRDKNNDRPIQAKISLYDLMTGESLYETSSDPISGQFYFVITTQRDIGVFVTSKGYMFRDFHFESKGSSAIRPDTLNILLDPLSSGISTTLQNIYFDWNSAELDQRSTQAIEMIVKFMEQHPVILEIHGHTDNTGSAAYNKELSYKRAQAVANALKKRGISDHRVRIYGHGSAYLIDKNPENQDQNRRIEFRISL